ncbi:MAG TPA: pyridoxamine 5'-phosphate oxidase [Acidimicrobiia bacterium]|nr:pyridoxamine 5'-phosphate oxidase [Acidimicrobiia bacterium]
MTGGLDEHHVDADPIRQLRAWYDAAEREGVRQPDAMTLATATRDGHVSARMVLLRGIDGDGLVFFTNYESRKGRELAENPRAALILHWREQDRQVRVEGTVTRTSGTRADEYWAARPFGSRVSAYVSPQSEVVADRAELERAATEASARFADGGVPRPEHWGGYVVRPDVFEFWESRADRLHDRVRYRRDGGRWVIERLAP